MQKSATAFPFGCVLGATGRNLQYYILDVVGGLKKAHHVAPGVHAAQWAGDPAAAHLEVAKEASIHLFFSRWQSRDATL